MAWLVGHPSGDARLLNLAAGAPCLPSGRMLSVACKAGGLSKGGDEWELRKAEKGVVRSQRE